MGETDHSSLTSLRIFVEEGQRHKYDCGVLGKSEQDFYIVTETAKM